MNRTPLLDPFSYAERSKTGPPKTCEKCDAPFYGMGFTCIECRKLIRKPRLVTVGSRVKVAVNGELTEARVSIFDSTIGKAVVTLGCGRRVSCTIKEVEDGLL